MYAYSPSSPSFSVLAHLSPLPSFFPLHSSLQFSMLPRSFFLSPLIPLLSLQFSSTLFVSRSSSSPLTTSHPSLHFSPPLHAPTLLPLLPLQWAPASPSFTPLFLLSLLFYIISFPLFLSLFFVSFCYLCFSSLLSAKSVLFFSTCVSSFLYSSFPDHSKTSQFSLFTLHLSLFLYFVLLYFVYLLFFPSLGSCTCHLSCPSVLVLYSFISSSVCSALYFNIPVFSLLSGHWLYRLFLPSPSQQPPYSLLSVLLFSLSLLSITFS